MSAIEKFSLVSFFTGVKNPIQVDATRSVRLALLIRAIAIDTAGSFVERALHKFDPIIGNFSCEAVAFQIYFLAGSDVFGQECRDIKELLASCPGDLKPLSEIQVSKNFGVALQARLLTVFKKIKTNEKGYLDEEMNPKQLVELMKTSPTEKIESGLKKSLERLCGSITRSAQLAFSESSVVFMQVEVRSITTLPENELGVLSSMLQDCKVYRPPDNGRAFTSLYFREKGVLRRIREVQAVVAIIQMIKKEDEPRLPLFYQSPFPGHPLRLMSEEAVANIPVSLPLLVAEGYFDPANREAFKKMVEVVGFDAFILSEAAAECQYKFLTLAQERRGVEDPVKLLTNEALEELEEMKKREKEFKKIFEIVHYSCTTKLELLR